MLRKANDPSREHAKPAMRPHLLTLLEQQLQPHADAEERNAPFNRIENGPIQASRAQAIHPVTEGAHAGKHHSLCLGHNRWIIRDGWHGTYMFERLLHAAQVAYARVNNNDTLHVQVTKLS